MTALRGSRAEERGATMHWLDFDPENFEHRYDELEGLIDPRTKLIGAA